MIQSCHLVDKGYSCHQLSNLNRSEQVDLTTDDYNMDEQPGPSSSSSNLDSLERGKQNEDLSDEGEENGGKEEFRSPKTIPMLPPEV